MKVHLKLFQSTSRLLTGMVLAAVSAALPLSAVAAESSPTELVRAAASQLIQSFARASDKGDARALQVLLHPAFRVVFNQQPGTAPTVLDRSQYLKMVGEGKIGGADRQVTVTGLNVGEGFASAAARMVRPDAVFQGNYSLIQQDGKWWLLEEAVLMTVVKATK